MKSSKDSRQTILDAAESLMSERGYHGVSMRDIAREAGMNVGSVTYHFGTKINLLDEIYKRHSEPMNQRRLELLAEAERITGTRDRLTAIVRAFVLPAFSFSKDSIGGGARFTRLRAVLSMEGNEAAGRIIAETFDETTRCFMRAIQTCLPGASESQIIWRGQFLLGGLYYTLVNSDRINRLTDDRVDGMDHAAAMEQLVESTVDSLLGCAHETSIELAKAAN